MTYEYKVIAIGEEANPSEIERILDDAGSDRWEFVSVVNVKKYMNFIMKREVQFVL